MIRYLFFLGIFLVACNEKSEQRKEARMQIEHVDQALREGKWATAEQELRELSGFDDRVVGAYQRFLAAQIVWHQAEDQLAQAQAAFGNAENWQEAVRGLRRADTQWRFASRESVLNKVACRNAERAQRRLAEVLDLARQSGIEVSDAAEEGAQQESPNSIETEARDVLAIPPPPTPERIDALLERVRQQEAKRRSERKALPGIDAPEVERDW
ncbi:MAG: hypothetical protein MK209_08890 [Planctomycetes bacterium]|nr:hypothetical protein [Planctomycetota bacterium]